MLSDHLMDTEQQNILDTINITSSFIQEKIFLNLVKLPFLIRIIPICSDIKFESKKNPHFNEKIDEYDNINNLNTAINKIFLYNPWEKSDEINYYWTCNSYQKIYVEFYNPLSVEIKVSKIIILFEEKKLFTFPGKYYS